MNRFLSAKHWVLFLLSFGIPMLFQIVMMAQIFISISRGETNIANEFIFFPVMMVLYMGTMFGWYWAVGIGLQKYLPDNLKIKTGLFKVFFFVPLIYIVGILFVITFVMIPMIHESNMGEYMNVKIPFFLTLIIPLHLFSMFCIFYCLYFVSRILKTAEMQREVSFSDFVGEFFLVWFFPIGIWFIQPRINKLIAAKE